MKKPVRLFLLPLLLLALGLFAASAAAGDAPAAGTHTLEWVSATGGGFTVNADGSAVYIPEKQPASGVEHAVRMKLSFSKGGDEDIPKGGVEIRLPGSIFQSHDGRALGTVSLPLELAPDEPSDDKISFHYYIDTNGDVILTNWRALTDATVFQCEITYTASAGNIREIASGTETQATAEFTVSGTPVTGNTLRLQVDTSIDAPDITKTGVKKYERWPAEWGAAPADAHSFFYVVWELGFLRTESTLPGVLRLQESPGNSGKVVGWYKASYPYSYTGASFTPGNAEGLAQLELDASFPPNLAVVVAYPRSDVPMQVENTVTAEVTGKYPDANGAFQTASDTFTATFDYEPLSTAAPADWHSLDKAILTPGDGAADALRNGGAVSFECRLLLYHMAHTHSQNNTVPYTSYLEDGSLYLDGEALTDGDWQFTHMSFSLSDTVQETLVWNEATGYELKMDTDYANYEPIEVHGLVGASPDWTKLGTVQRIDAKNYFWTPEGGQPAAFRDGAYFTLPQGARAVQLRQTGTQSRLKMEVNLRLQLLPTDHVKELLKDSAQVTLYNAAAFYATDAAGSIFAPTGNDATATGSYGKVLQHLETGDIARFGQEVTHDIATAPLTGFTYSYGCTKAIGSGTTDTANARDIYPCTLQVSDMVRAGTGVSPQTLKEHADIHRYEQGVFYDLLPRGAAAIADSVTVYGASLTDTAANAVPCSHTVEFEQNWRGSGRTMMIVRVQALEENIVTSPFPYAESCFTVTYDLIYDWESRIDFGAELRNVFGYFSLDGALKESCPDDASAAVIAPEAAWLADLDGDGNPAGTVSNVRYGAAAIQANTGMAQEVGFNKKVKTAADPHYTDSTTVSIAGDYSYRLRMANEDTAYTTGVVLYDVLEEAYGSNGYWQGGLTGIDVSQITAKGIDVKIYYSTAADFGDLEQNAAQRDLTDTARWSLTPPARLADVTALAFDLGTKTDGSPYVFSPNEAAVCQLYMQAPGLHSAELAYNRSYLQCTLAPNAPGGGSTRFEVSNTVTVAMPPIPDVPVTVQKLWQDAGDQYGVRPQSVTVQLYADGVPVPGQSAQLSAAGNWQHTFTVPQYGPDGRTPIVYTVQEAPVPGYAASYDAAGLAVTNTLRLTEADAPATLRIQKYAAGTATPLAGAVFALYDAAGALMDTAVTDAAGVASFVIAPPAGSGTTAQLTLTEQQAPAGYAAGSGSWTVQLTRSAASTLQLAADGQSYVNTWSWSAAISDPNWQTDTLTVYNGALPAPPAPPAPTEPTPTPPAPDMPDTGDVTGLYRWALLLSCACIGLLAVMAAAAGRRRKAG